MSFQGDVAGIGLGELLQGLARGERNGVLTLSGKRLSACVGLRRGQVFLLPGPDEDESLWRDRCVRAFADDANGQLESSRRGVIARAARLETFYQIMEASNLHFRFDPGALPPPPSAAVKSAEAAARGHKSVAIDSGAEQEYAEDDSSSWGTGMPVEYLLLEHARISDEVKMGLGAQIFEFDLPRAQDPERQDPEVRDFLEQLNGVSTIQEVADRLGWPLSKCRGVIGEYMRAGLVRVAQARELLAAAQREMELGRPGRAGTRLTGWLARSQPGPLSAADAQLLLTEWNKERLPKAMAVMEPRCARAVLRRLDRLESDKKVVHERWRVLAELHKQDEASLLHEVSLRLASSTPNSRTFSDLLRIAHSFHARGLAQRTRMLLRLCANHLPEGGPIRVELGRRMLEAGLMAEGSRWLLNTAREFLAAKDGDAALLPIRAVLRVSPDHNEARALLEQAQVVKIQNKRRRWSVSVALSAGLALSLVALVKFHDYRQTERWISSVDGKSAGEALQDLALEFGDEPPARIAELRTRLERALEEDRRRGYDDWSRTYREAEEACRFGDPLLGFSKALDLPSSPPGSAASTPDTNDLLGQLARRLGAMASELDVATEAEMEKLNDEERLLDLLTEFQVLMKGRTLPPEAHSFQFRIDELHEEVRTRRDTRASLREKVQAKEKEKDQDILLATARAHDQAGDLERALAAYKRLLESDPALEAIPELMQEIERVRAHYEALEEAMQLCEQGHHAEAERVLRPVCPRPIEHLLPYKVDSLPSGARVTLSDGRVRTTPFKGKSGFGEHVTLELSLPGFQTRTVEIERPGDLLVSMNLFPERGWKSAHKVEAAPVPSGDDHVVADRLGRVARLDQLSNTRWEIELKTISGIARTPVFLPNKSGWLLVISEDGQAWLVQSQTGEVEGPRDIGSPPAIGPELTRGGVSVQFTDGRVAVWTDRLEPVFYQADSMVGGPFAKDGLAAPGVGVLRRSAGTGSELASPWNGWVASVREGEYRVVSPDGKGFSAERSGDWVYMAWEKPKALVPFGRLWVSDGAGLRSYVPDLPRMVPYPAERRESAGR
jgi:tetratricopeptide (TPR) repeat protein